MSVIIILLLVSITVAAFFLLAFLWSIKKGQFDDEESPPVRMLFDDVPVSTNQNKKID
ncbi:MAG: cbb3-type cytochrome oxidase assembly protein CcoS [Panacibacter sp.]